MSGLPDTRTCHQLRLSAPGTICIAIPWNTANSDVPDWIDKVFVGRIAWLGSH